MWSWLIGRANKQSQTWSVTCKQTGGAFVCWVLLSLESRTCSLAWLFSELKLRSLIILGWKNVMTFSVDWFMPHSQTQAGGTQVGQKIGLRSECDGRLLIDWGMWTWYFECASPITIYKPSEEIDIEPQDLWSQGIGMVCAAGFSVILGVWGKFEMYSFRQLETPTE